MAELTIKDIAASLCRGDIAERYGKSKEDGNELLRKAILKAAGCENEFDVYMFQHNKHMVFKILSEVLTETVGEIICNTAVVGYQEIISDPTNTAKIVCMTYPLIGNYGLTDDDYESKHICTKGLIVREYNEIPSNFRYTRTLEEVMKNYSKRDDFAYYSECAKAAE